MNFTLPICNLLPSLFGTLCNRLTASFERRSGKFSHLENMCDGYKPIEWQILVLDAIDMLLKGGRRKWMLIRQNTSI
ncbi:hypothetical protein Plhal304r1_c042g0122061 [Plasmopara halstedii]